MRKCGSKHIPFINVRARRKSIVHYLSTEQMQQALVWPNYSNHNSNVAPPPLLLPPPPPSIQLLGDIGGARLVLTENKRKQQSALPIVKIETECSNSPTTIISTYEHFSWQKGRELEIRRRKELFLKIENWEYVCRKKGAWEKIRFNIACFTTWEKVTIN